MLLVRLCPMVLMLTIAGCAGRMGTIHTDAAATPTVTSFDGSYQSTIRVTDTAAGAQGNWCESPGQPVITVANGQFSYAVPHPNVPGNPAPSFPATIAQDGSFSGQVVSGTISGRVQGTHMAGTINGQGCVYGFTGERM
jgi:hypothetical protein